MVAHARLKNEFTEDKKCHNLMSRFIFRCITSSPIIASPSAQTLLYEPTHEVMALIALRKLNLQTRMRSNPLGLHVWFLVEPFVYVHTLCVRTAKALARLRGCAVSPEPSLFAFAISNIISWAGSITCTSYITKQKPLGYPGHELGTGVQLGLLIPMLEMYTGIWKKYTYICIYHHEG